MCYTLQLSGRGLAWVCYFKLIGVCMYDKTKNVPVPKREGTFISLVRSLEIDESFCIPVARRKTLSYSLWMHKKDPKYAERRFITRTLTEEGQRVVRCWRIA